MIDRGDELIPQRIGTLDAYLEGDLRAKDGHSESRHVSIPHKV